MLNSQFTPVNVNYLLFCYFDSYIMIVSLQRKYIQLQQLLYYLRQCRNQLLNYLQS